MITITTSQIKTPGGETDLISAFGITLFKDKLYALNGNKTLIEADEILTIPENFEYNIFVFDIDGVVECNGNINILN